MAAVALLPVPLGVSPDSFTVQRLRCCSAIFIKHAWSVYRRVMDEGGRRGSQEAVRLLAHLSVRHVRCGAGGSRGGIPCGSSCRTMSDKMTRKSKHILPTTEEGRTPPQALAGAGALLRRLRCHRLSSRPSCEDGRRQTAWSELSDDRQHKVKAGNRTRNGRGRRVHCLAAWSAWPTHRCRFISCSVR
jgi:hypothetical protein